MLKFPYEIIEKIESNQDIDDSVELLYLYTKKNKRTILNEVIEKKIIKFLNKDIYIILENILFVCGLDKYKIDVFQNPENNKINNDTLIIKFILTDFKNLEIEFDLFYSKILETKTTSLKKNTKISYKRWNLENKENIIKLILYINCIKNKIFKSIN